MIKNNIGRELKKAEKSQAWLAAFAGIPTGMVSQLVSGRSVPTSQELSMLCAAFLCRAEALYSPDVIALIKGTEKPEQDGAKSYRGKHVLLTDQLADEVDAYAARYGLTRNESARTLIIIGLREHECEMVEGPTEEWIHEEVMRIVKAANNPNVTDPAGD